jgi:uncharacterized protein YbcV (DUF1398 family)
VKVDPTAVKAGLVENLEQARCVLQARCYLLELAHSNLASENQELADHLRSLVTRCEQDVLVHQLRAESQYFRRQQ